MSLSDRDPRAVAREHALEPARRVEAAEPAAGDDDVPGQLSAPPRYGRVERRALLLADAAAQAPRRAREGVVRDGREPLLVGAQREQQVRDPVGRRQVAVGRPHAEAVDALSAVRNQDGACLAEQPDAERAALHRQPGLALQVARVVAEQVAEQPLRDRLGVARCAARAADGSCSTRGRRAARGSPTRARSSPARRERERLERDERRSPRAVNGTTNATVWSVQSQPQRRR